MLLIPKDAVPPSQYPDIDNLAEHISVLTGGPADGRRRMPDRGSFTSEPPSSSSHRMMRVDRAHAAYDRPCGRASREVVQPTDDPLGPEVVPLCSVRATYDVGASKYYVVTRGRCCGIWSDWLHAGSVVLTDRDALFKGYNSWLEANTAYSQAKARGDVLLLLRTPLDDKRLGPIDQAIQ